MFMPPEKLGDLLKMYNNEARALKEQVSDLCYFMKGGIEYNTAWGMCHEDREIMVSVVNRRLKESNPGGPEYM